MKLRVSNEHQQCSEAESTLSEPALGEDTDATLSLRCDANWTPVSVQSQQHRRRYRNLVAHFRFWLNSEKLPIWQTKVEAARWEETLSASRPNAFPPLLLWAWKCALSAASQWARSWSFPHLDNSCGESGRDEDNSEDEINKGENCSNAGLSGDWI